MRNLVSRWGTIILLGLNRVFSDLELIVRPSKGAHIELLYEKKRDKYKKRWKKYKNGKFREKRLYREKFFSLKGSQSKDHRYSHQKKIRRMFTNT